MKKSILFVMAAFTTYGAFSQNMQYGAELGLNISFASAKEPGVVFHGTPGIRYALGGFVDMPLSDKRFSIRPSLLFSRESYAPLTYGDRTKVAISYINIPIPVIYHSDLSNKKIFFGFGPYFGYALSGKYSNRGETNKIVWGSDPNKDDGKRLDFGLDFRAGYELEKDILLIAKFDFGIKQIATETDLKVHTRNFGIAVQYTLGSK